MVELPGGHRGHGGQLRGDAGVGDVVDEHVAAVAVRGVQLTGQPVRAGPADPSGWFDRRHVGGVQDHVVAEPGHLAGSAATLGQHLHMTHRCHVEEHRRVEQQLRVRPGALSHPHRQLRRRHRRATGQLHRQPERLMQPQVTHITHEHPPTRTGHRHRPVEHPHRVGTVREVLRHRVHHHHVEPRTHHLPRHLVAGQPGHRHPLPPRVRDQPRQPVHRRRREIRRDIPVHPPGQPPHQQPTARPDLQHRPTPQPRDPLHRGPHPLTHQRRRDRLPRERTHPPPRVKPRINPHRLPIALLPHRPPLINPPRRPPATTPVKPRRHHHIRRQQRLTRTPLSNHHTRTETPPDAQPEPPQPPPTRSENPATST